MEASCLLPLSLNSDSPKTACFGRMLCSIALYCDCRWPTPQPPSSCQLGIIAKLVYVSFCLIMSSLLCIEPTLHGTPCTRIRAADEQGVLREIISPANSASVIRVWMISDGDQGWMRSPVAPSFWVREMDDMGNHSLLYLLSISFLQLWLLTFIVPELIVGSHFSKEKSGEECSVHRALWLFHTHPASTLKHRESLSEPFRNETSFVSDATNFYIIFF